MSGEKRSIRPVIELVTHCYAVRHPGYAAALRYQLSSLVFLHSRHCDIICTVCYTKSDRLTKAVVNQFMDKVDISGVSYQSISMKTEELGRRCIGRNKAALKSKADIVWFTDVDHVFLPPCMDALIQLEWPKDALLIYPKKIMIHKDHDLGDDYLSREPKHWLFAWIDIQDFIVKDYDRPVGGVQIVRGDTARKYGYLNTPDTLKNKWHKPTNNPFSSFKDDVTFRKLMKEEGGVCGVEFDGVYRLRHTHVTYPAKQKPIPRGING